MTIISEFQGAHRFLSNFWLCKVRLPDESEGLWYRSVEHAYQAAKFPPGDPKREAIRELQQPEDAKHLAAFKRRPKDCVELVRNLVRQKYAEPYLRTMLLRTGDAKLVEGNWWHDNFWGSCSCHKCAHVEGMNHLGRLTEQVRSELDGKR